MNIKKIESVANQLSIFWQVTTWCNYNCEYCCDTPAREYLINEKHEDLWRPVEFVQRKARKINDYIETLPEATLGLIGGEVTCYDLVDLLSNYLTSNKLKRIHMVSNMSRPAEYFDKLFDYCKSRGIQVDLTGSYHPSQVKDRFEFFNKVLKYTNVAEMVVTKDNQADVDEYCTWLKAHGYSGSIRLDNNVFDTTPVIKQDPKSLSKSPDVKVTYEDGSTKLMTMYELQEALGTTTPSFRGWKCTRVLKVGHRGNFMNGHCGHLEDGQYCLKDECPLCLFLKIERE